MLVAYQVALELIRQLRPIVEQIKVHDAHLADQLKRAATNTLANLAEGQRRAGGNKRRAYENAHGEAREMLGCLDGALAWGYALDDGRARSILTDCSACAGASRTEDPMPIGRAPSAATVAAAVAVAVATCGCSCGLPKPRAIGA